MKRERMNIQLPNETLLLDDFEKKNIVSYDAAKLKRLIKAYDKCKPKQVFTFEGRQYLKEYAGYLIEHLKNVFKYKDVFEYKEVK